MIRMDYSQFLDKQKEWAAFLVAKSGLDSGAADREYALLGILAMNRLFAIALQPTANIYTDDPQDLPSYMKAPRTRAA
ncbi:MAG: hypothetical protein VXV97_16580 [Pseudomonadota bacterium]|nr:hypothetical protein [Pseudomonadota bacterium]